MPPTTKPVDAPKITRAKTPISLAASSRFYLSSPAAKNKFLSFFQKLVFATAVPCSSRRGASRSSRTLGAGCGGRGSVGRDGMAERVQAPVSGHLHADERCRPRTSKSCGPGALMQALSRRKQFCRRRWQPSVWSPRRARIRRKPSRAGMPGDFRCDRCEYSCAYLLPICAHEAAGASGARHPPRPLSFEGQGFQHRFGRIAPRERGAVS